MAAVRMDPVEEIIALRRMKKILFDIRIRIDVHVPFRAAEFRKSLAVRQASFRHFFDRKRAGFISVRRDPWCDEDDLCTRRESADRFL